MVGNKAPENIFVNDIHSQLNRTPVRQLMRPTSIEELKEAVRGAQANHLNISISSGRHAMGGQPFGKDTCLIDMRGLNDVVAFDFQRGLIDIEAGIEWPDVIDYLIQVQQGRQKAWGIIQKQTGADRLSLGGSLSANVHGRGLTRKPIIDDVESFVLMDVKGDLKKCSRSENPELFRAAIGGYGVFGIIVRVELRLAPRIKLRRMVKVIDIEGLMRAFEAHIKEGFVFGDFQYATDESSDDFLRKGVFSCYQPVSDDTPIAKEQKELSMEDWVRLYTQGHHDKTGAFNAYSEYYRTTSGQIYWSDSHQLSLYPEGYHQGVDQLLGTEPGSEMITEVNVPRVQLTTFMNQVREDFRSHDVDVFYGTIRLIEKDAESLLPWAKESYVCIIFNLHTAHTPQALNKTAVDFRRLIDRALALGGTYYLTYHRWATRRQVTAAYPRFPEFLELKLKYDPDELIQSDWYRHYRDIFRDKREAA